MRSKAGRDWRVIMLLVGGGGSGLLAVGVALSVAAYTAFEAWRGTQTTSPMAQMGIDVVLGALVLIGAILDPCGLPGSNDDPRKAGATDHEHADASSQRLRPSPCLAGGQHTCPSFP